MHYRLYHIRHDASRRSSGVLGPMSSSLPGGPSGLAGLHHFFSGQLGRNLLYSRYRRDVN